MREDINPYLENIQEEMGPIDPMMGLGMTKRSALKSLRKLRGLPSRAVVGRFARAPGLKEFILSLPRRALKGLDELLVAEGKLPAVMSSPKEAPPFGVYMRRGVPYRTAISPTVPERTMVAIEGSEFGARALPEEIAHHIVESRRASNSVLDRVLRNRFEGIRRALEEGIIKGTVGPERALAYTVGDEAKRFQNYREFWAGELSDVLRSKAAGVPRLGTFSGDEVLRLMELL